MDLGSDYAASPDLPDIRLYQEVLVCLEMLINKILDEANVDVSVVYGYYGKCEELLNILSAKELNSFYKVALQQLICTFHWHKELLHFQINRPLGSTDNGVPINNTVFKSALVNTSSEQLSARQKAILGTIVNNKKITLKDVVGLNIAKQTLREAIIIPLQFPHLFTGPRKSWSCILLYGPPGTGKSRLGQAIAAEIDSVFFNVSSADLLSSFIGESEKAIKELFRYAQEVNGSSVVFIDEIDSISRKRNSAEDEHSRRIKTELLKQIDGIDGNQDSNKVFLLCATNCPWDLDIAFLRRFQRRIYITLPDRLSRMEILKLNMQETAVNFSDADWNVILDKTEGFSGSDLASLTMSALLQPIRELQTATSWILTQDGHVQPVVGDIQTTTLHCQLQDFSPSQVIPRPANLNDFLESLNSTHRTVTSQELARYEVFTKQFGQLG